MSVIGSVEPTFGRALRETGSLSINRYARAGIYSRHPITSPGVGRAGAEVEAGQWWSRVRDPNVRSDSDWTLEYKLGVRVTYRAV